MVLKSLKINGIDSGRQVTFASLRLRKLNTCRRRGVNLFQDETGVAFNANEPLTPSPTDVSNPQNSIGYNWILVGNINPITYNTTTGELNKGTQGAIFYKGNISNESFRLDKQQLLDLYDCVEYECSE